MRLRGYQVNEVYHQIAKQENGSDLERTSPKDQANLTRGVHIKEPLCGVSCHP